MIYELIAHDTTGSKMIEDASVFGETLKWNRWPWPGF